LQESGAFEEVDELAERVLELIDAGQYDEAEATARQLESEYPGEPLAIERLGQVHEAKGSGDVAAEQYRRAVTLSVLPFWPRGRYLELAPKYWAATRARIPEKELAVEIGDITVPPPLPSQEQSASR
jgi:hypothetical protein